MKWLSIAAALVMIASCFFTWIVVPGKAIYISGINAAGTTYGKPGYLNLILGPLFLVLTLVPRVWAKRCNLGVAAINLSWTFRNYLLLARCEAGDCPQVQLMFWVFIGSSVMIMLGALLTGVDEPVNLQRD
jgi:hypothetical protein